MTTQSTRSFRFRACLRCGGDAYLDLGDEPVWRCLLCSRVVPPETSRDGLLTLTAARRAA